MNAVIAISPIYDFNSIKVRLEPSLPFPAMVSLPNFNSIKVRLEPKGGTAEAPTLRFQFHKGTIRTR